MSSSVVRPGFLLALALITANFPSQAVAQTDVTPPRIISVSPDPVGVVDQLGLTGVTIGFSEPVSIAGDPVHVWGVTAGALAPQVVYDAGTNTLTLTFDPPVQQERVVVAIEDGAILDTAGNVLDGEIAQPFAPVLPSGDGVGGGLAAVQFHVLQGDADLDGTTNADDMLVVLAAMGVCAGDAGFDPAADLNRDGCINVLDVQILVSSQGLSLPILDGIVPAVASTDPQVGSPVTTDVSTVSIVFTEPLEPLSVMPGAVTLRTLTGEVLPVSAPSLSGDGLTLRAIVAPAASSCGNYTLALSTVLSDLSGEMFVNWGQILSYPGSVPPAVPVLDPYVTETSGGSVTINGSIPAVPGAAGAAQVKITGGLQSITLPVSGSFSTGVQLQPNAVNVLYVSAISPCGIEGPPLTATVIQDGQPPSVSIQYPLDGVHVSQRTTDVTGTVGDMLSGFAGLSVTVNGVVAAVDIGQGTNGTFFAQGVPLQAPGVPTKITAIATDALGNVATKSATVTQQAISPKTPFIEAVSGNAQTGLVHTFLGQPIRAKLWQGDGTPFANKLVSFRITRNDGTLEAIEGRNGYGSGTQLFQALTDDTGEVAAAWKLGGTAGCGANRVEVTAAGVAGAVVFCATSLPGVANQINIGSGNNQRVEADAPAPLPLSAWVSDSCNPGADVGVTFRVVQGSGLVNGQSEVTVSSGATGHAEITFVAGPDAGTNRVEADFPGNQTNPAVFVIYGIDRDFTQPTTFRGLVLDNASRPIGGAKAILEFQGEFTPLDETNAQGQFEITGFTASQSGSGRLHIDGTAATQLNGGSLPDGTSFPSLTYDVTVIPNAANVLGMPVLLPPLDTDNAVRWDGLNDVELTCEGIDGLRFIVKANSMTLADGTPVNGNTVTLSINQVHHDDIPMPMPDGVAPPFAWTFQPAGATFDPPVAVEYPNMSALPPGAIAYFLTFNHDTGAFEIVASGSVSDDGSVIRTDPDTGLTLSGWGCNCPPYSVTAGVRNCCYVAVALFKGGPSSLSAGPGMNNLAQQIRAINPDRVFAEVIGSSSTAQAQLIDAERFFTEFGGEGCGVPAAQRALIGHSLGGDTVRLSSGVDAELRIALDPISRLLAQSINCVFYQRQCEVIGGVDLNFLAADLLPSQQNACMSDSCIPWRLRGYPLDSAQNSIIAGSDHSTIVPMASDQIVAAVSALLPDSSASGSIAHLNDSFVLSAGGQSIQFGQDGSYKITNVAAADQWGASGPGSIPDFQSDEPARVIGSGVIDGQTWYVFSEHFRFNQGETIVVDDLTFTTTAPPIPASLTAVAAKPVIEVGESMPIMVTATLADGSRQNVTSATAWTTYVTSNPAAATVDVKNGIVTAHAVGTVFITAKNGAATAVERVLVTAKALPTTIVGSVQLQDGTPVEGAVVVTPLGGQGVSGSDGVFELTVTVAQRTPSLSVTAVAQVKAETFSGTVQISPIVPGDVTDAGVITISAGAACEPSWIPTFGPEAGVKGTVYALTAYDDGSGAGPALYVGGDFTTAGVSRVARWDGSTWSALGSGVNSTVRVLTVYDDEGGAGPALYAGGEFTTAGGETASRIARWDGSSWSALDSGVSSTVRALAVYDDGSGAGPALYAGGSFVTAGGVVANRIARWDGSSWSALGSGMTESVHALTVHDDGSGAGSALYAGGLFTTAGGVAASRIARWDGSSWSALGSGVSGAVRALAAYDDGSGAAPALYAGGSFATAGGVAANRIARWDGSSWSDVGSGATYPVYALTVYDDGSGAAPYLYAGGQFSVVDGVAASRIARWDGSSWSALGSGVSSTVYALTVHDDGSGAGPSLYVGGLLSTAGDVAASRMARWNGSSWSALGSGVSGTVNALTVHDDGSGAGPSLYAGGRFTSAGGVAANRIARWDGSSWSVLGSGMTERVRALAVYDDGSGAGPALYAGGEFTTAGGEAANGIARWDGSSWSTLGSGVNHTVNALTAYDDGSGAGPALYAGGRFSAAGGVPDTRSIARWNGSSWSALGSGVGHAVYALTVYDDGNGAGPALYAGGTFTTAGGVAARGIARWDGSSWSVLGSGVPGDVFALTVYDDGSGAGLALYVGGQFQAAGPVATTGVARWVGLSWSAVGGGVGNYVKALTVYDNGSGAAPALYAGGGFYTAGGVAANRIARWDGSSWSALGSGIDQHSVEALTAYDDGSGAGPALFAGGSFTASPAGDSYLAKWGCTAALAASAPASPSAPRARLVASTPNLRRAAKNGHTRLGAGETLSIGAETIRLRSLHAEPGATLHLGHANARLVVQDLIMAPGAVLEWLEGTIEIDEGMFIPPASLDIGCQGPASLVLNGGASVFANHVRVCPQGRIRGEGMIDAGLTNAGVIAPVGSGLTCRGSYLQHESGSLRSSCDRHVDGTMFASRLLVEREATLAGGVEIMWPQGLQLPCPEDLRVLSATSVDGDLEMVGVPDLPCDIALRCAREEGCIVVRIDAARSPDLDCDDAVTFVDIVTVLDAWGECPAVDCCPADIAPGKVGDGVVDAQDLAAVLAALGDGGA